MLGLAANLASALMLIRYKGGDANVRSVWLCSRNDAIGNVAVMIAAAGVWGTGTAWPRSGCRGADGRSFRHVLGNNQVRCHVLGTNSAANPGGVS